MKEKEIELSELDKLRKELAEKETIIAEQKAIIEELLKDNETIRAQLNGQISGEYSELYTEKGVDYIITSPTVYDARDSKTYIKTSEYFAKNEGFAALYVKAENSTIKLKGGTA